MEGCLRALSCARIFDFTPCNIFLPCRWKQRKLRLIEKETEMMPGFYP